MNFSNGKRVKYTVTSENKAWQRVYSIGVREQSISDIPNEFHFEDVRLIKGLLSVDEKNTIIRNFMRNKMDWN